MPDIQKNVSLKPFNTFGVDVTAQQFVEVKSLPCILNVLPRIRKESCLVLGMGSNVLFLDNIKRLVVFNALKGKSILDKTSNWVDIEVASGENWHEFVLWTLENDALGLENLSLIPGTVGAAPIQNIGAYGVEVQDYLQSVKVLEISTGDVIEISASDCHFGYRDSIFKSSQKGKYIVLSLIFKLNTPTHHHVKTSYGAIAQVLEERNITEPTAKDVSQAVISIRESKLPDYHKLGNAGSFFKNPIVEKTIADTLIAEHASMPHYDTPEGVKIPAGWLIEQCGFRGYRSGHVGSYEHQALIVVNFGGATGREIYDYSEHIIDTVNNRFGIQLEREVNVISD